MRKKIVKILNKNDISEVGFVKLEYFKELEQKLLLEKDLGYDTPFQVGEIDDKVFKNGSVYKSGIVCLIPYQKNNIKVSECEVYVSSSSWGRDYHEVLKTKLLGVSEYLVSNGYKAKVCVDNNILDERYLAYKAGLGFYGVNNLLINEKYGSNFFIGVVLTDAVFTYDKEIVRKCNGCMECVRACPSGAISEIGILNGRRCLSYITQKKELEKGESELIGQCIYGCDICSNVCPHNRVSYKHNNFMFDSNVKIDVYKYKKLSNKEFKDKYGGYAFSWRGKNVFERNIDIYKQKLENRK